MSRFYKAEEELNLRFYQMPKALFNNEKYKGLSLGAKAMYSILRDRQDLSIKNNWIDEDGYIYLLFKIEPAKDDERPVEEKEAKELSLMEILEVDRKTVMKYKKELVQYDLIVDKRMGQGKTNRMYILKPELPSSIEKYEKSKKGTSRSPKKGPQEVQKLDGNDTEFNDTDFSDTINQSQKLSTDEKENERKKENPENEFEIILENSKYYDFEEKYSSATEQALRVLYYSDKPLKINNMNIPPAQIREDLKRLEWKHLDLALRDFKIQSEMQEIRYPIGYLSRCIYNAIFQSGLKIEAELRHNGMI